MLLNSSINIPIFAGSDNKSKEQKRKEKELKVCLDRVGQSKEALIPPVRLLNGINPNNRNVFDTFEKLDNASRKINFVKGKDDWDECLLEELQEFTVARQEYNQNPSKQNYDHMEEEMGDVFFTAASIAKNSGINPEEAFRTTNRKFYNRINIMERLLQLGKNNQDKTLKDCRDYERRALWNAAKRKLYDAQSAKEFI